jgi:hypothetical protein
MRTSATLRQHIVLFLHSTLLPPIDHQSLVPPPVMQQGVLWFCFIA